MDNSEKTTLRAYQPSFGRTHGRVLKTSKQAVMADVLPELLITAEEIAATDTPVHMEIGFGNGEHLCHRAVASPEITFIGCEVYEHGIANCLKEMVAEGLTNIRFYTEDARLLLESMGAQTVDKLYLLFPDPWPKSKHHKRRIVKQDMLGLIHHVLKDGGEFAVATDHHEYAAWIMVQCAHFDGLEWTAEFKADWRTQPQGHSLTRYQAKNKAQTEYPVFLNFKKMG